MPVLVICGVIVGVVSSLYLGRVSEYQRTIAQMSIADADLSHVADGVYEGSADADLVAARVTMTVKDGRIENVALLEHRNERGAEAEQIPERIVQEQRITVDAVTGATNSSMIIEKACEQAIRKGLRPQG